MKLFYYNKKDLTYKSVKVLHFVLASVIVSILTYMYGYLEGREDQIIHLTPHEKEIILLNVSDTTGEFSTDKMVYLMKELNIKYPHIVYAQSLIETGHFDSKIFKENNNLFGMKTSKNEGDHRSGNTIQPCVLRQLERKCLRLRVLPM